MKKTIYIFLFIIGMYFLSLGNVEAAAQESVSEAQLCSYWTLMHGGLPSQGECEFSVDLDEAYKYYIENEHYLPSVNETIDIQDILNPSDAPEFLRTEAGIGNIVFSERSGLSSYNNLEYSYSTPEEAAAVGIRVIETINHLNSLAASYQQNADEILNGISDVKTQSDQYDKAERFAAIAQFYVDGAAALYSDETTYTSMLAYYTSLGHDSFDDQAFAELFNELGADIESVKSKVDRTSGKVSSCIDVIGANLRIELQKVFDYFKLIVPGLIIVLGSIDLAKSLMSSDGDKIKAAQKSFMIRLSAGIGFFFLPGFINLILDLANVGSGTCGIN